jgi:hypothetical protein
VTSFSRTNFLTAAFCILSSTVPSLINFITCTGLNNIYKINFHFLTDRSNKKLLTEARILRLPYTMTTILSLLVIVRIEIDVMYYHSISRGEINAQPSGFGR